VIKIYTIFAIKNATDIFQLGSKVERNQAFIKAAGDTSFVATDGFKMFIVGEVEAFEGIKKSDTGFGSTCGATPAKVQELAMSLCGMGYNIDVSIAYDLIDNVKSYHINKEVIVSKDEDIEGMESYFEFTVPSSKEEMIEKSISLAMKKANVFEDSDAFVAICEFYLKQNT